MANRTAAGSGNWSNIATWDGGTAIPVAGDNVAIGAYNITLDTATIPATGALGAITATTGTLVLNLSTMSVAISAATITAGSSQLFVITGAGGTNTLTINVGTTNGLTGGSGTNAYGMTTSHTSTGAGGIFINGAVKGGTGATSHGVLNTSTGPISITGNVTGGAGAAATSSGLRCNGNSTCAISGDITGGAYFGSAGVSNQGASSVINLSATSNLIDSATALAWVGVPPVWTPTATSYWTHVGSRFAKEVTASDLRLSIPNGLTAGILNIEADNPGDVSNTTGGVAYVGGDKNNTTGGVPQ